MEKNKQKLQCSKCSRDDFKSRGGLARHDTKAHPYIPPPPPVKTVERAPGDEEQTTLINGRHFSVGDIVWLGRKCVITKLTRTEGSPDIEVILTVTKRWYSAGGIS